MAWTPPSDAVETTGWTPPQDKEDTGPKKPIKGNSSEFHPLQEAGTALLESTQDFFKDGFLGRAAEGLAARAAFAKEGQTYKYEDWHPKEKEVSLGEGFKQMYKAATESPLSFLTTVAKSVGQDPELLFPGLWEYTPAKLAQVAAKVAESSKAANAVVGLGGVAVRGAAVMGGAESVTQLAEGRFNPSEIEHQAELGSVFGLANQAVAKGLGKLKSKATPTNKVKADHLKEQFDAEKQAKKAKEPKYEHPTEAEVRGTDQGGRTTEGEDLANKAVGKSVDQELTGQQELNFDQDLTGGQGGGLLRGSELRTESKPANFYTNEGEMLLDENGIPFNAEASMELAAEERAASPQMELFTGENEGNVRARDEEAATKEKEAAELKTRNKEASNSIKQPERTKRTKNGKELTTPDPKQERLDELQRQRAFKEANGLSTKELDAEIETITNTRKPSETEGGKSRATQEGNTRATQEPVEFFEGNRRAASLILDTLGVRSERSVVEGMQNRSDAEAAIKKLREKAAGFDEIIKRRKQFEASEAEKVRAEVQRKTAQQKRQQLLDYAEHLEQKLRDEAYKPESDVQGPKTREAKSNLYRPGTFNSNPMFDPELWKSVGKSAWAAGKYLIRTSKDLSKFNESGFVTPELLLTMGMVGAGTYLGITNRSEQSWSSFIGSAIEGGVAGYALSHAPTAYAALRYETKGAFVERMMVEGKMDESYRPQLEAAWEKNMPAHLRNAAFAERAEQRHTVARLQERGYMVEGARRAATIQAVHAIAKLKDLGITPEMEERFYNVENGESLSPEDKKKFDTYYTPVKNDLTNLLKEIAGLTGKTLKDVSEDFMPRYSLDHQTAMSKLFGEHTNFLQGKASSTYQRTMYELELPEGGSMIVSIKNGNLQGWQNGNKLDLGKQGSKGPKVNSPLVDSTGKVLGTLRQGSVKNIEQHSPVKYYKNAVGTIIMKRAEAQGYLDQLKFYKDLRENPEYKEHIGVPEESNPNPNWRNLNQVTENRLPFFKGTKFNPRFAEAIEDLMGRVSTKDNALVKLTNLLTKAFLLNPIAHMHNEAVHWAVAGEGMPDAELMKKAYNSVSSQDELQQELLKSGISSMYSDRWVSNEMEKMFNGHLKEVMKSGAYDKMQASSGLNPIEWFNAVSKHTGDLMWHTRDTMVTQLALHHMENGMTTQQAVRQVMKDMPNYRLPPRVGEEILGETASRFLSNIGQSNTSTAFFRYHYAIASEYGNMAKGIAEGGQERTKALNHLGRLIGLNFLYNAVFDPMYDAIAKKVGLGEASIRKAGPLHWIESATKMAHGEPNAALYFVLGVISPPLAFNLVESALGTSTTGIPSRDTNAPMDVQIGQTAKAMLGQTGLPATTLMSNDKATLGEKAARMVMNATMDAQAKTKRQVRSKEIARLKNKSLEIMRRVKREIE